MYNHSKTLFIFAQNYILVMNKRIKKYFCLLIFSVLLATSLTSCWYKNYEFLADDAWSEDEINDERIMINSEIDLDDMDR